MTWTNRIAALCAGGAGCLLVASMPACSKPQPPKIQPEAVMINSITPQALNVTAKLQVTNPNDYALSIRWFTADVTIGNGIKMPQVRVEQPVNLPPKATTPVSLPVAVPWANLAAVTALGVTNAQIPYVLDGVAGIGNESFEVQLSAQWKGNIPRDMLMKAVGNAIPKMPGLPSIPGVTHLVVISCGRCYSCC